jgi:hypothetical protein
MLCVAEAIFGLIGVVVGALITGGVEYVMRVREEKTEMRAAARLTHAELGFAETLYTALLESGRWEAAIEGAYIDDELRRHQDSSLDCSAAMNGRRSGTATAPPEPSLGQSRRRQRMSPGRSLLLARLKIFAPHEGCSPHAQTFGRNGRIARPLA